MSYNYRVQRPWLFTEEGSTALHALYEKVRKATKGTEAISCQKMLNLCGSGDSWNMLAMIDRLEELGSIALVSDPNKTSTQGRIYRWTGDSDD